MAASKPQRRELTPAERADATRLSAIYKAKKGHLQLTQEKLAALMGINTQGAISQYMNGRIAMSNEIVMRFAHHLEVDPAEIRPKIWDSIPLRPTDGQQFDAQVSAFAARFARHPAAAREFVERALDLLDR